MKECPRCRTANAPDAKFCQRCGQAMDAGQPQGVPDSLRKILSQTISASQFQHFVGAEASSQTVSASAAIKWPGVAAALKATHRKATPLDELFGAKQKLIIGRSPDSDICLPHPTISRHHALLEKTPAGLRLRDLNSVNGVFVDGHRITESVQIRDRERVGVGPFLFSLINEVIYSLDSSKSLRLEARGLEKVVTLSNGEPRKLLENINLVVEPGEFISLLGPSGSGKSTLMDCLNGRRPATGGAVLANGEDFYRHYDSFRQSLGYVPQKDIVHWQLTVSRALYYTAKLRLPTDTDPAELESRVEEVLRLMELLPHRNTVIGSLSGGQIKRVSLGAELLARPCLLYIDEATSGLDAGTEARIMRLFRELADEGKSVICITHNVDNVDRCNTIIILMRGKMVYFGPPKEALDYFRVRRLGQIYDRLAEEEVETWESEFQGSGIYQEFVVKRLARDDSSRSSDQNEMPASVERTVALVAPPVPDTAEAPALPSKESTAVYRPPLWHQFRVLTRRYAELMWGDRRSFRLMVLQAPIVALFVLLGFVNKPYQQKILAPRKLEQHEREALEEARDARGDKNATERAREALQQVGLAPEVLAGPVGSMSADKMRELLDGLLAAEGPVLPDKLIVDPRFTYMLLFIIAVTIMWLGCNNAAKEIVKEEAIYGRERAVNLGILPYLASKFLVLTAVSALQTFLVLAVIYGTLEILHLAIGQQAPYLGYRLDYLTQYAILVLLSMSGISLGLLLSAVVATPDRANSLLPYVLIPQIILGGAILPIRSGPLYWVAFVASPVYWAYRGIRRGATTLPADLPIHMTHDDSLWIVVFALSVEIVVLLAATAWCLRRKDVRHT